MTEGMIKEEWKYGIGREKNGDGEENDDLIRLVKDRSIQ